MVVRQPTKRLTVDYGPIIEGAISEIEGQIKGDYGLERRAIALLLLQEDPEITRAVQQKEGAGWKGIEDTLKRVSHLSPEPPAYTIALARRALSQRIVGECVTIEQSRRQSLAALLSNLTINPVTGVPVLLAVLYFGLYKFVGEFGAGTLVDLLETNLFENVINPWVNAWVQQKVPWELIRSLIGGEYGIVTLGLRYAIAIILPIVATYFFAFAIMEDTGYLPRLALLLDRLFKSIGLSGRAVIPMTLGFGCDTMATVVSRTLETRRERVIATFLLALAIPCSAQLGVILGLLSSEPRALWTWALFLVAVFMLVAYLTSKLLPGQAPSFYMEVPPLRLPQLKNVLSKTYARMYWYLVEVIPVFLLASVLIWLGDQTGALKAIVGLLGPLVTSIGLPPQTAEVFLFGFFRRDYGAAGLYDLQKAGALSLKQLVVTCATLTLFVPCIAQFVVMVKERGARTAIAMAAFIFPFAFLAGGFLNWLITVLGVLK